MEVEPNIPTTLDFTEPTGRSPNRLRYEAEVAVFRKKHGDLEAVRIHLGLSRRKLCQLLMVDPSAWTRWSKDETKVPPHVYRLLEFYLADGGRSEMALPSKRELAFQEQIEGLRREIGELKVRRSTELSRISLLTFAWVTLALLLIWLK